MLKWVSPFRYLRIIGYLLLPEAFRSLSRLSSALSAKASTLRSYQHNQLDIGNGLFQHPHMYSVTCVGSRFVFTCFSQVCNHYYITLFITITSDVLIKIFKNLIIFLVCGFQGTYLTFSGQVENTRVELVTSCLQGRRSPN